MESKRQLQRLLRWSFLALIILDVALALLRILSPLSAAALEAFVLLIGVAQVVRARRLYQRDCSSGRTVWQALEDGFRLLLPGPLARFFVLELRLWACLFMWAFRRAPRSANTFSYLQHSSMGVMLIALGFSAPLEFLLYELLIPWQWVRILLVILGVYAIFWALAFVAALHVLPHVCEQDGLLLRYGIAAEAKIPYAAIQNVEARRENLTGRPNGFRVERKRQMGAFGVGGMTQVRLTFDQPVDVQTMTGRLQPVTVLDVAVDSPERFVSVVNHQRAHADPERSEQHDLRKFNN